MPDRETVPASPLSDTVPSGVTNVTSPTSGCKVRTGNSVLCSEGALSIGGTFTITLNGTAPSTNGTCFTNSATVGDRQRGGPQLSQ